MKTGDFKAGTMTQVPIFQHTGKKNDAVMVYASKSKKEGEAPELSVTSHRVWGMPLGKGVYNAKNGTVTHPPSDATFDVKTGDSTARGPALTDALIPYQVQVKSDGEVFVTLE